jgi:diaminopropionate ammonia-lyase
MFDREDYDRVAAFYDARPDVVPTPLRRLPALAAELGVRELMVKDESARFGLPAFKAMGALYAVNRLLQAGRLGRDAVLVAATSGNHGRAVARVARDAGLRARIYVPHDAVTFRIEAIAGEGAEVVVTAGNYNDAVRQAAREAEIHGWQVISDISYPGYEEIPRWIMAGYTRLMHEASQQWDQPPDVVLVQGGVGGLVCGVASWFAFHLGAERPYFICCEPLHAACLLESARAGAPVAVAGELDTKMEGLRCAEISAVALPAILATVNAFAAIEDKRSFRAMRRLADGDPPVVAGASGACGLAALTAILEDPALRPLREAAGLSADSRVLLINSEGATDPALYKEATGAA